MLCCRAALRCYAAQSFAAKVRIFLTLLVSWVTELGGGDFLYLSIPMILLLRKECQWVQLSRCLLMRTTIGSQDMSFSRNSNWSNARFLTIKRSRPFGPFRF